MRATGFSCKLPHRRDDGPGDLVIRPRFLAFLSRSRFQLVAVMLIASLAVFALTRTVLLAMSWSEAQPTFGAILRAYAVGTIYDIAFYIYAAIPIALYLLMTPRRWWRSAANRWLVRASVFATLYGLGFIAVAEVIFWEEFQVRFNFIAVDYLVYSHEVTRNIYESYPIVQVLLGLGALAAAGYWLIARHVELALGAEDAWRRRLIPATALLLLLPVATYAGVGQGLQQVSTTSYINELAENGAYQFIAAFRNNHLDYAKLYPLLDQDIASERLREAVKEPNTQFVDSQPFAIRRSVQPQRPERRLNVVLVTVESLSADYLTRFGNDKGITPNLDKLAGESLFFTRFYATGTRTVRGLEAVTLSIPPTPGRAIVKRIGRETGYWSLGNVLREKGYDVRFVYGGRGYFDNMNAFFSGNGYDIVDQSSVPDAEISFQNAWGMADEDLYAQVLKNADAAQARGKPFFFHVMTTSNHRPYTFPEGRIDLPSGKAGRDGAVKYTDWAIGDFLAKARQHAWFDDTVFVFLADHCAASSGRSALPINRYHIPMWIYSPKHIPARVMDTVSSQIDVAPTVLALLGTSYVSNAFGKDILAMKPAEGRAVIGNHQHLGLYRPGSLWVLGPQRKVTEQHDPESGKPTLRKPALSERGLQETIAYYQGGSYVFDHRLNAWNDTSPTRYADIRQDP
jgi:phosphoglycerol transferase MdoB-like AlkP superfamily enzyme